MDEKQLGRLEKVDLREYWNSEPGDFTPWLAQEENIELLGNAIGLELEVEAQERNVGPFRADILCKNLEDGEWVLIENQLEQTDHIHLGQLMTYAAGLSAVTIVWISPNFREEHRAALDWLNEITDERFNFFGLEIELWQIGGPPAAPKFNLASKPNNWTQAVADAAKEITSETGKLQREFWSEFQNYMQQENSPVRATKAHPQNWMAMAIGRSGLNLLAAISSWDFVNHCYRQESFLRAELTLSDENAKFFFDQLIQEKDAIEAELGTKLHWYNQADVMSCRIYIERNADIENRDSWPELFEWLRVKLEALNTVFRQRVKNLQIET